MNACENSLTLNPAGLRSETLVVAPTFRCHYFVFTSVRGGLPQMLVGGLG